MAFLVAIHALFLASMLLSAQDTHAASVGPTTEGVPPGAIPRSPVPGLLPPAGTPQPPRGHGPEVPAPGNEATAPPGPAEHIEEVPGYRRMIPPATETEVPPGEAAPYTRPPPDKNGWRWIPRIVLYLPRRIVEVVTTPLEYGLVVYQKYRLKYRVLDVFFDDRRTFGVIPTAFIETGLGLNGGVRVIHRDLFGHHESLHLRVAWGGLYRHVYSARFGLGDLLGRTLNLSFDVKHAVRPRMRFYGIGNDTEIDDEELLELPLELDPVAADVAVDTRYSIEEVRWGTTLGIRLADNLQAVIDHRWTWAEFNQAHDLSGSYQIAKVFDADELAGWREGLYNHYTELALEFRRVKVRHPWISRVTPSSGWEARIYGGAADGIRGDPTELLTSGGSLTRYFDLYNGDRVLILKAAADAVHGRRDRIPFTSYPTLGGPDRLRGYKRDRFRDRFSTLLTVEYRFPVNRRTTGFLLTDVGRVWPRPWVIDVRELDRLRASFGGGVIFHIGNSLLTRLQLAGSLDGTVFFFFGL